MIQINTVVYPSAGHHDKDPGAMANGRKESDMNIDFRNLVSAELTSRGHRHIMDKDWETNTQHQKRIKPGPGSVLIDFHFDAASPSASGTTTYYASNANKLSIQFAQEIVDNVSEILGIPNRGARSEKLSNRGRIGILHTKAGIACLLEIGFITNLFDIAMYEKHKVKLAKVIAEILIRYDNMI